ncbi:MAG: hypothetical protein M1834_003463 [Cirrosporium novae-zelandiae]|nr:MAG: hypothetical protein M1834_003463 [Cirrosporium novae-zelandiae]
MSDAAPPGPTHDVFCQWAQERGVEIHNVGPARFTGRGIGICSKYRIKAGDVLVHVPATALLTIDSIPTSFSAQFSDDITVHGLLAAFLHLAPAEILESYHCWQAVWPSLADFREIMPILWLQTPAELLPRKRKALGGSNILEDEDQQDLCFLPPSISGCWGQFPSYNRKGRANAGHLVRQRRKLLKDFATIRKVFPNANFDDYTYYWLLVNTRTFYWEVNDTVRNRDDCMALCPFADYFNHADEGCQVTFGEDGFTMTADRDYESGQELFVSYGCHDNDFLWTEYGFILKNNKWDLVYLDDIILAMLSESDRQLLEEHNYLGNYVLTKDGACYRTQVAMRLRCRSPSRWKKFIRGEDTGEEEAQVVDGHIRMLIDIYRLETSDALKKLEKSAKNIPFHMLTMLKKRWEQIQVLLESAECEYSASSSSSSQTGGVTMDMLSFAEQNEK